MFLTDVNILVTQTCFSERISLKVVSRNGGHVSGDHLVIVVSAQLLEKDKYF